MGSVFERALVRRFREVMPRTEIRRGLQSRSGEEVPDIEIPCFWPEAKHHRRTNIKAALDQAVRTAPPGRWPLAICKDDHQPPVAAMLLDDFVELVGEWWEARNR